ncbi:hypothetical protein AMTR_s00179p00037990 [Amborella trichopoda]|uniref:Uncharacterized protein n=1 Tax=Amborella trichopoda TaxID=13333 RepID=W1PXK8_AMBTC|nr:hypothetical protein AMTR_s00179p00037990 [Amborella trichopoda]
MVEVSGPDSGLNGVGGFSSATTLLCTLKLMGGLELGAGCIDTGTRVLVFQVACLLIESFLVLPLRAFGPTGAMKVWWRLGLQTIGVPVG